MTNDNQMTPKQSGCGSLQGSQASAKHRATIGFELEVLAKKTNAFGWDRDYGTPIHARLIEDWMNALQGYPLDRVKAACEEWVKANPRKMAHEGDILAILNPKPKPETYAQRILREYGGPKDRLA